jgi:hypothetical protein
MRLMPGIEARIRQVRDFELVALQLSAEWLLDYQTQGNGSRHSQVRPIEEIEA